MFHILMTTAAIVAKHLPQIRFMPEVASIFMPEAASIILQSLVALFWHYARQSKMHHGAGCCAEPNGHFRRKHKSWWPRTEAGLPFFHIECLWNKL